jgi:hypothetical protein
MDALVDALEHDPVEHAPAPDAGCRPDKRGIRRPKIMLKTIIDSAMMIHSEHIAL